MPQMLLTLMTFVPLVGALAILFVLEGARQRHPLDGACLQRGALLLSPSGWRSLLTVAPPAFRWRRRCSGSGDPGPFATPGWTV